MNIYIWHHYIPEYTKRFEIWALQIKFDSSFWEEVNSLSLEPL